MNDKSTWSPSQWQAYVAFLPSREQRKQALDDEVPPEWRSRVEAHVRTVYSIKAYSRRLNDDKKRRRV